MIEAIVLPIGLLVVSLPLLLMNKAIILIDSKVKKRLPRYEAPPIPQKPNTNKTIMKKYRLKKEVLVTYAVESDKKETLDWWQRNTYWNESALEEVPQRIELEQWQEGNEWVVSIKGINEEYSFDQMNLIEQALNGELFTKDDILDWNNFYHTQPSPSVNMSLIEEWIKSK